jgi:hypothetical protein
VAAVAAVAAGVLRAVVVVPEYLAVAVGVVGSAQALA